VQIKLVEIASAKNNDDDTLEHN